jgi:hypothetical protein
MSTTTALTKTAPTAMSLSHVRKGKLDVPLRILLHGVEGVGKSSFAASAPSPIFLAADNGTAQLDIDRFPEPQTWDDVIAATRLLQQEAHEYRTLVIDPLNWIEPICWAHVCKAENWKNLEEPGFGKGFSAALDTWRLLLSGLERLWSTRRMNIVLIAHSMVKPFKNPEGEDFDRYQIAMNEKAAGLWKQWCDVVLFAKHGTAVVKDSKTKRIRGVSTGAREMHTCWNAAFDAKNRHNLPEKMPLSWADFADAVDANSGTDTPQQKARLVEFRAQIEALLGEYGDEAYAVKARGFVAAAKDDINRLAEIQNRVEARVNAKEAKDEAAA